MVKVDTVNDVVRLVTPGVVKAAQKHFGCDNDDYGGTLEIKASDKDCFRDCSFSFSKQLIEKKNFMRY